MASPEVLVRLEVPARPAFVGVARSVIATVATALEGLDDDRLDDLRLAVSEACTNAVSADGDGRMVLRCLRWDEHVEVEIEDGGHPPTVASDDAGFGLQLITALVDHVTYEETSAGTLVRLRMDLSG